MEEFPVQFLQKSLEELLKKFLKELQNKFQRMHEEASPAIPLTILREISGGTPGKNDLVIPGKDLWRITWKNILRNY